MRNIILVSSLLITVIIIAFAPSCKKKNFSPSCSSSTPSYANDVKPLIQSKCVSCHSGYSTYTGTKTDINKIRETIIDGSMPKNGSLSTDEKNKIICWIDGGAPNN